MKEMKLKMEEKYNIEANFYIEYNETVFEDDFIEEKISFENQLDLVEDKTVNITIDTDIIKGEHCTLQISPTSINYTGFEDGILTLDIYLDIEPY